MNFLKTIVAAGLVAASTSAFAADITGAGATFPFPLYSKWADAYKKETGNGLNYQSIGSGAGIKQIQAKTVTFGASDMPLKPEQLEKEGMIQWPQAMGALVPVVNLEGIKPGELVFSGELLGDIYLGKVKKWNDPAIAKLNPKLKLPRRRHHRRAPFRRLRHHVHLDRLPLEDQRRVEDEGRFRHRGRVADGRWRQGQRRRRRQCQPDQELDRLCRIRLCQAEQADLRRGDQQGRQDRAADHRSVPGGGGECRLGRRQELLRHPDRPARRSLVADHRRDLHPDAQGCDRQGGRPRKPSSSSSGRSRRATRWPRSSTTFRCRSPWSS